MTFLNYPTKDFHKESLQHFIDKIDNVNVTHIDLLHKEQCEGTHLQVNKGDVIAYFSPTLSCFCKRPVHRYYTMEYGPILECASYDETKPFYNPRFVCGFHVHELAWLKLFDQLQEGLSICSHYLELRACPLFNFTYCALFKVTNNFKSRPIALPTCFCGKSIKIVHDQMKEKLQNTASNDKVVTNFICANRNVQGAPKCDWLSPADKSVFPKPKYQLHSQVDEVAYNQNNGIIKDIISTSIAALSLDN